MKIAIDRNEEADIFYCKTPIGVFDVIGDGVEYNAYLGNEVISRGKDLKTAKEDARTYLFTMYYKLKLYLEI